MTDATTREPKPTAQRPFTIAVCGGGIGGLALAVGLLHQGVPVHVYEAAHAFAEIGAGIGFGPNSVRAMSLIDPAIQKGFEKRATHNAYPEKRGTFFDFRHGMDGPHGEAGALITPVKDKTGALATVHRAHFLDELVKLVPDECASFGKRVEEVEEVEDGVKLTFHDGSTAEASAVVGCDGIKSRVRAILLGDENKTAHAQFTGKYAYRGLIPMDKAVQALGDELARNSQMYCGYHGHVLTFPIEKGEIMNVVAFKAKSDGKWEDERWVLPMKWEDLNEDYKDWGDKVKCILALMEKPDLWAMFDHLPAATFTKGRICLLGDSAHASTPHQGAGAGMALEDAYVLSNLLGSIHKSSDIERAFKAYDAVRRPRAQKLVVTSREAGTVYEFEADATGDDPLAIKADLDTRWDWIWGEDLPKELEEARKIFSDGGEL
ncbi:mannitol 1-phosphate dehydrogenase [Lasallia pustulata]|uniref:Mannitol 1-phosphate dehydrogenase n=1 Tax=Lasallia pustulata TaxID=136370 RepID=A0A1W5CXF4_9LECA|nr:mannitol 1-phosphate dehydrogenase [Lasallia pustulata]